ncbi:MAG: YaaA family protein [Rikenellaceae bacterium]
MIALISPAKTMLAKSVIPINEKLCSKPYFLEQAQHIVSLMLQYNASELQQIFKISYPLAQDLKFKFTNFLDVNEKAIPAIDSYDGVVYKHFKKETQPTENQQNYLQQHLRISSLLYGILKPLDLIKPYRMEGFVRLAGTDERVDRYWRDLQTERLIEDVNNAGGTLLYLASKEEQNAFHWKEVKKAVRIIDFQFLQPKGDKLKQVVIYTKMARGEMVRYMIDNNITNPEELKTFEWGGYRYDATTSKENLWNFVNN